MKTRNSAKSSVLNDFKQELDSMNPLKHNASTTCDAQSSIFCTPTVSHNTPAKDSRAVLPRKNISEISFDKCASESVAKNKDFNQTCFYFDNIDQVTLSKYSNFILKFGGRICPIFNENVTHLVTERHLNDEASKNTRKFNLRPRKTPLETPSNSATPIANASTPATDTSIRVGQSTGSVYFNNFLYTPLTSNSTINSSLNLTLSQTKSKTSTVCDNSQVSGVSLPSAANGFPDDDVRRSVATGSEFCLSRLQDENVCNSTTNISLHINQKTVVNAFQSSNAAQNSSIQQVAAALDSVEDILKIAAERKIVIWSKDDLRANLVAELKKYEASKANRSATKGLAEYLAEEKRLGGSNRNAITNSNLNASASKRNTSISASTLNNTLERFDNDFHATFHAKSLAGANATPLSQNLGTNSFSTNYGTKQFSYSKSQFSNAKIYAPTSSNQSNALSSYHVFKHPYILIEDFKQEFRPIYKEYAPINTTANLGSLKHDGSSFTYAIPKLNFSAPPFVCPFSATCNNVLAAKASSHVPVVANQAIGEVSSCKDLSTASLKAKTLKTIIEEKCKKRRQNALRRRKLKGRVGYCECCYEVYTDLEKHSRTPTHRTFATCALNYSDIDRLISTLARPRSIIETVLQAPKSPKSPAASCKEKRRVVNFFEKTPAAILDSDSDAAGGSEDDSTFSESYSMLTKSPCCRKWAAGNPDKLSKRDFDEFSAGLTLIPDQKTKCKKEDLLQTKLQDPEISAKTPDKPKIDLETKTPIAMTTAAPPQKPGFITRRIVTYVKEKHSSASTTPAKQTTLKCRINLSNRLENECVRSSQNTQETVVDVVNYSENIQNSVAADFSNSSPGIVDKISSLLQVISKNALRSDDDLTVHHL